MIYLQILLSLFIFPGHRSTPPGAATVYWPGDGHCGKHRADGKLFLDTNRHFAHRTLPLGTKGFICSTATKKCAKSYVGDRGPYGALLQVADGPSPGKDWVVHRVKKKCFWKWGGVLVPCENYRPKSKGVTKPRIIRSKRKFQWYQVQIRLQKNWIRRGNFDLTRVLGEEIQHKAFQKVIFFYIPRLRNET